MHCFLYRANVNYILKKIISAQYVPPFGAVVRLLLNKTFYGECKRKYDFLKPFKNLYFLRNDYGFSGVIASEMHFKG